MSIGLHPRAVTKWIVCPDCGWEGIRGSAAIRCAQCAADNHWRKVEARKNMQPAHAAVNRAIRHGELRPATEFDCVDCGRPAECYDHRDYLKPLDVDPVCKRCDNKRGPGANRGDEHKEQDLPRQAKA